MIVGEAFSSSATKTKCNVVVFDPNDGHIAAVALLKPGRIADFFPDSSSYIEFSEPQDVNAHTQMIDLSTLEIVDRPKAPIIEGGIVPLIPDLSWVPDSASGWLYNEAGDPMQLSFPMVEDLVLVDSGVYQIDIQAAYPYQSLNQILKVTDA